MTPLYTCHQSGVHEAGLTVVRDAAHWRALWPALGGCAGPTPPAVDFARRAVDVERVTRRGDTTYISIG